MEGVTLFLEGIKDSDSFDVLDDLFSIFRYNGISSKDIRVYWYCTTLVGITTIETGKNIKIKNHWWMITDSTDGKKVVLDNGSLFVEQPKRSSSDTVLLLSEHSGTFIEKPSLQQVDEEVVVTPEQRNWWSVLKYSISVFFHPREGIFSFLDIGKFILFMVPFLGIMTMTSTIIPFTFWTCWGVGAIFFVLFTFVWYRISGKKTLSYVYSRRTIALCLGLYSLLGLITLIFVPNYFIRSKPEQYDAIITEVSPNPKRNGDMRYSYDFIISSLGLTNHYNEVPNETPIAAEGDTCTITVSRGIFGMYYIDDLTAKR